MASGQLLQHGVAFVSYFYFYRFNHKVSMSSDDGSNLSMNGDKDVLIKEKDQMV